MRSRLDFHEVLKEALGSSNVYFQPPAGIRIEYPAIIYNRTKPDIRYANDDLYMHKSAYEVIVIDKNPDSEIVDRVMHIPFCSYGRHYVADNLNHDTFTIYY